MLFTRAANLNSMNKTFSFEVSGYYLFISLCVGLFSLIFVPVTLAHFPLFVCSLFMFLFSNFCIGLHRTHHIFFLLSSKLITAPFFVCKQSAISNEEKNCIYLIAYTSIRIKSKKKHYHSIGMNARACIPLNR